MVLVWQVVSSGVYCVQHVLCWTMATLYGLSHKQFVVDKCAACVKV